MKIHVYWYKYWLYKNGNMIGKIKITRLIQGI